MKKKLIMGLILLMILGTACFFLLRKGLNQEVIPKEEIEKTEEPKEQEEPEEQEEPAVEEEEPVLEEPDGELYTEQPEEAA